MLAFGRLGDLRGQRRVFLTGFAILIVGSALCGLAPTVATLIAARAIQALGAAMLFSNSIAILVGAFARASAAARSAPSASSPTPG